MNEEQQTAAWKAFLTIYEELQGKGAPITDRLKVDIQDWVDDDVPYPAVAYAEWCAAQEGVRAPWAVFRSTLDRLQRADKDGKVWEVPDGWLRDWQAENRETPESRYKDLIQQ